MTHDSTNQHLSLEPDYDGFDPLEDFEDDATEVEGRADEFVATVSAAEDALAHDAMAPATPAICEKPAEERIADLLEAMAPRRTVLLDVDPDGSMHPVTAAGSEGVPAGAMEAVRAVNARVDELQENNFSVYSAANLCSLLEKAGAIERVTAEGEPAEDIEIEPQTVVVDGVEYLEAREPVEIYWHITEPGRAALEADKPLERLRALLDEDAAYAPIYQRILRLCTADGGATTPAINNAVDHTPLVQKPRFYAPHFVDRLEKCDALAWKKAWCITDIGRAGLDMLADVVDENAPATQPETPATPDPAASKED